MSEPFEPAPSGPSKLRAWFLLAFTPLVVMTGNDKSIVAVPAWLVLCAVYAFVYTRLWSRRDSEIRLVFDSLLITAVCLLPWTLAIIL